MKSTLISLFLTFSIPAIGQNFQWTKRMGGTLDDSGKSIAIDGGGNVYSAGIFKGTADFEPDTSGNFTLTSAGSYDAFIAKQDASGNFLWVKRMGGTGFDECASITTTGSGNVYMTGLFSFTADIDPDSSDTLNLTSAGLMDLFISALDPSGNLLWARRMGGTLDDYATSIATDDSGNVYVTGYFRGTADFDPDAGTYNLVSAGLDDAFVVKLDATGNFLWAVNMGGTGSEYSYDISLDDAGGLYVTGSFQGTSDFDPGAGTFNLTSAGMKDLFILKLDASGNFSWGIMAGGAGDDEGSSIAADGAGNVLITGFFNGTADFDPGVGIFNLSSQGAADAFIAELDGSGNFLWAKNMGGTSNDYGSSIVTDISGNLYLTGYFSAIADFDPDTTGIFNLTSSGSWDIFIARYDGSGNFIWAENVGGTGNDRSKAMSADPGGNGDVYVTGSFNATADFDPGPGTQNLISAGSVDIFILKLGGGVVGVTDFPETEEQSGLTVSDAHIYPNPANGKFIVFLPLTDKLQVIQIEVFNVFGEVIIHWPVTRYCSQVTIDLSGYECGIYFVKLISENRLVMKKLLVH